MNALDDLLKKKTGGSRTASSGSASGEKPVSYVDALLESKKGGNADSQLLYTNALKASQGQSTMQTPYADAAAQMKSGTNNNFFHGIAGIFEKAAAGAKEGLRTDLNEAGYRAQAANPLNAADDAYYKAMWEQTTGRKTGIEIPADTRTQQQKDLDEYMGVADLKNDRARAMQRAAEKEYERLDKEGVKTAFQRDNTYQERVDQRYADLGPKWQQAMSIAESVGNQALPMAGRLIGTALLGEKGGEAFQSFLFFNQASGAAIEEALEDGASWDKALTYGTVIGSIEAATEAAGDMANKLTIKAAGKYLPKEQFTKALIGTLTSSKTMRTVLTLLGQMNGEGLEEVASDLVSPFAKSIYNGKTLGENWMDDVTIRGLWESYLAGAISGGFLSGIDGAVNGRFRAQNESYANETVNAKIEEARASMKENGLFNSETREKIIDAGTELGALETQQQTAAQEAREHMQMIREMQRALRGDVGAQERISRMQEGTYTTETQNAPVSVQRVRTATDQTATQTENPSDRFAAETTIPQSPAATAPFAQGSRNMKGEFVNGQSAYQGRENGSYDLRAGGQAAAEGRAQALTGGRAEIPGGVGADTQADLRQVTPAQLGIQNGGAETVTVVDAQKLGGEAKSAYDAVRETGLEPVAVRGAIQISNGYANAYTQGGRVFFRVDAVDSAGNIISPEMLVQHEMFHNYASEDVIRATDEVIRASMTAEEYDGMYESYRDAYASIYDFDTMNVDEIEQLLTEEIAADAYAGLNWFSGEAPAQEAVRTETERNAPARRAEAQRETTGPPKGQGAVYIEKSKSALESNPNSNAYVLASSIPLLQNSEVVKHLTGEELNDASKPLDQQISDLFASVGNVAHREGFGEVELNRYGVDGIINHKPNRSKVLGVAAIKEVIEKGYIIKTNLNWKGRGYDSYMIAAPVGLGDATVYVAAVVNRDQGTNKFYLDEVVDQDGNYINIKNEAPGNTKTGVTVQDGVTRGPKASSDAIVHSDTGNSQEKSSGRASVEVNPDDTATQRLKERQFELIQNNHPKEDWDYQTWINSVDDVKTYQEAVDDDRAGAPDFDDADIDRAMKTGRVRVYSSHRIRIGTFVTPSRMEAENYAGSKNVYSKTVPLTDVAWIDSLQGQFAPTSGGRASVEVENRNVEMSEEDARRERLRKLQEADRREAERIRARENHGAGQRFVPNKSSGEVYRDLMGKGKSEVKVQMTGFLKGTPKDSTFKVEVKQTPIGKYYEATIFHDGHKADTLVRALKETAARDAAEEVITMANKNFSEENYQRAKKFEAEKTADEDARIAELFGDPEQPDNAETSRESSDAAETENAAAKETIAATTEKVTSEVIKAERNYREDFEKITSGAMRMFVNAGDTVRRIAKATGSKSLEGYYFNAGAYSQRAGNWIAKGGARTDIDGHRIGASLADTLAPMRKNETKYRDFQLYLLHMHNVDRMKYDNSAELERIKENLRWVKEKYPQLKELSKEELRRIANSDSDSPVVRQAAHEIYLAAHNGEAPSLTSVAEGAAYALELERQRAIVEKQGLKPVFGYDVTADDSQTAAQLLAAKNPEFKEWAKEVYKYSDDLIRYRVEAGLITREFADALKKRYPHYIPTFREEGTNSRKARSARRNGGIVVSNAIGRAVGSDGVLLPLHTALSRKTVSTMRNAGLNQFGLALVREYDGNKKATEKYIWDVAESEYTPTEAALESDEDYRPVFENIFSVKENGKAYDITMDEGLTAAMKAFEPDKFANYGAAKAMKKLNDVFKAMNTAWSPWFLIKNAVRDFQDAGFYSTDMKTWLKMFPQAKRQIRKNGEIWQQYKALGGSYSSMLDYTTGMVKEPKNKLGKLWARFELLQQQVEAAPRLAEFMTILANSGGSKDGKFTQNDLMEAMLGAADITTNFARGGSVTKMLNRYLVPFLNPSVQGFDKFIRNATGVRSVQAAGKLILSAALWGILPQILNELMWWDDDEWDDIPASTKSNYYLIKLPGKFFGDGYWIKIPKGRAVAVLGTLAVYGKEKIEGEDVKFSDVFEVIKSNIAPTDIFNQNIATAFTQTKLLNPDNPGTTWYGGNIESDRLQNYRPGERYDEKTDEFSKWLGKTFNVSPKKINYLLDQYTGVFGDILLPMMTPATNAASKLLAAPMAAFTIDTTSTNKTTGEYYDLLDDLKYDTNDGDVGAGITRKYVSHAGDEVNDYYAQIRALQNDKNLSDGEKNRLVRALKKQLIERQKEIIAKAEPYREAVDKYLKAHPELATDNDAAIAEYAELYDITEDQAESRMDAIVYRECNREVFGAEYALRTYNADVYDKARTAYAKGVSYETYYDYYFATKEMHADKDENGKSISGSKKAKVVEYINSLDIPAEQKDALYVAAGYTEKSAKYQKWNGGSGGSGSRRGSGRKTTLKAPTPKAGKIVIPEASAKTGSTAKTSGNALAPSSKTAKTSGNVIADFTQKSSGTDIRKAVTQAKKRAIKAGNRTLYVEEGSPIDYFLKYGKLPSVK